MKLKNRLFLAFFLFAFLPVAIVSYVGLELMIGSRDRVIAPGISRALKTADSLAALSIETLELRTMASMALCDSCSSAEDYTSVGFDFAAMVRGDSMSFAGLSDSLDLAKITGILTASRVEDTTGSVQTKDKTFAFAMKRRQGSTVIAGYVLPESVMKLRNQLGVDIRQFEQLKLLRSTDRNFVRLIWGVSNFLYLLLILYVTRVTANSLTRPLARLERLAETVGPGRWEMQLDYSRDDEIGSLVSGFNRMSSRLSEATRQLIESEKKAAWESTARVISHGIKNVLAPVKLALARLTDERPGSSQESSSPIDTIRTELQLLENTARDFSLYGRSAESAAAPFDLNMTLRASVRLCESHRGGEQIAVKPLEHADQAFGDENMLREAFVNLIRNACEASDENQPVNVTASVKSSEIEVKIHNSGRPIENSIRERIFEPYVTTKPGGTGLGLAIAKKAVESSGGFVSFETGNNGTTFIVRLKRIDEQRPN